AQPRLPGRGRGGLRAIGERRMTNNVSAATRIDAGSLDDLRKTGRLVTKLGSQPVCVLWDGEAAYAVDDRCPHLGFPLHRGTVEQGMVTCHWHHARFDLVSGCTLDPFADDVRAYPVTV